MLKSRVQFDFPGQLALRSNAISMIGRSESENHGILPPVGSESQVQSSFPFHEKNIFLEGSMNQIFKLLLRERGKNTVLIQLRERLLNMMLYGSFLVGTILFGLALIPVWRIGLYPTIIIYSVLYVWTILITFDHKLPYKLRAFGWLAMLFVFGCVNLFNSGLNIDAGLFLITFIAMSILLMDLPAGLTALLLASIVISILGFLNTDLNITLPVGLPQSEPLLWIIGGIIFFLVGTLLIYSLTNVVTGLEENLSKTSQLADELEKTVRSLRLSETRYRTLVETSPGLVVMLDLAGNIVMVNPFGLQLYGYDRLEEVTGKSMLDFVLPDDREYVFKAFQDGLESGGIKDINFQSVRKDGATFAAELNATVILDEGGKPQAVIGVGRDVTARNEADRLLREAKEGLAEQVALTVAELKQTTFRLEKLVKNAPTIIYTFRPSDRVITYISENVTTLLGYPPSSFTGDPEFWRNHLHPEDMKRISAELLQPKNQEVSIFESRFLKSDGSYCWLRGERKLLRAEDGTPLEYIGSLSDISDLKNTEESIRHSEARYRDLYENMIDAYAMVNMESRIVEFNRAYQIMMGYEPEELRKLTYLDLTPKRWHDFETQIVEKQVIPNGFSDIYEKEYIRKDGTIFPVELRTVLLRDEAGNPVGMWAIIRDISGRKVIDQILRESEARYRELLDNSLQGVIVFEDTQIAYVNRAITELLGYSRAELETLTTTDIILQVHPEDRHIFEENLQAPPFGIPSSERFSLRVIHNNGTMRWLEARSVPMKFQGKPAQMVTVIDVTDIKRVEAELQESERNQRTILNASDALVFLLDRHGHIMSANDKFVERMNVNPDTIAGTAFYDILPHEIARTRNEFYEQVIESGKPASFVDSRAGVWFENNMYPIRDASGKVISVAVYARDITEQRRVTEALRLSEEQYRTLAEASHDFIFIIDRNDQITYVNSFGANLFGLDPRKVIGQPRELFFPTDTNQHQLNSIMAVFRTGQVMSEESANKFPTGIVWLNTWLVPLRDSSGEVTSILGVSRDITERKKYEVALQEARDRLEERVTERTQELMVSQEKMRMLTVQTVKTQEDERRSISRELHDEAGQALITLKFGLASIQNELPGSDVLARQRLGESMNIIDQTMTQIRGLAHRLRPPVLDIGGIHLSLQDYCQELTKRTQIPISYDGVEIPGLPDEIGISLFRFVQEAVTNTLKHAHATELKVRLQYKNGEITLSVSDNGHGITASNRSDGVGLLGIRERLNLLNGKLEIHSQKGRGAKLVAHVPWSENN
jgi:PAS domain S-box-containing protein